LRSSPLAGIGYAALGALALALALPGANWWPLFLLFPGFMLESVEGKQGWKWGLLLGLAGGTIHWMVTLHWFFPLLSGYGAMSKTGAAASLVGAGVFLGITWAPVLGLTTLFPSRHRPLVFPVFWILAEAFRSFPPYEFPWNTTSSILSAHPGLLPSLAIWGAPGLGWAMVAIGSGIWALGRPSTRKTGISLLGFALVILLLLTFSSARSTPEGTPLKVAILQPGTLLEERWDPANWEALSSRVWSLSKEAAKSSPNLILWPESAMPFEFGEDASYREAVEIFARESEVTLLLNSVTRETDGELRNSAFAIRPDGKSSRYDKLHLVPFGEHVPPWARFFFPSSLVHEVGGFSPGRELHLLEAGPPVGMSICYEIVFPRLAAAETRKGAGLLMTLTNDGWYGRSWALDQHFAQAVLRAVECRRWVIRAALTGISGMIAPDGRVTARLGAGERGILIGYPETLDGVTLAARLPDWWNFLCLLFAVLMLVFQRKGALSAEQL